MSFLARAATSLDESLYVPYDVNYHETIYIRLRQFRLVLETTLCPFCALPYEIVNSWQRTLLLLGLYGRAVSDTGPILFIAEQSTMYHEIFILGV